MGQEEEE